jgi:hypothetical protein
MATGDYKTFDEALLASVNGTHDFDTHSFKMAICDNTTVPAISTASPNLSDFTEVGDAGNYTAGGTALTMAISEASGTLTVDTTTNPTYAADADNDTDAYWGIIYNTTSSNAAVGFIDLGGPVNMSTSALTVTINSSGLFTIARA